MPSPLQHPEPVDIWQQPIVDAVLHKGAERWSIGSDDAAVETVSPYNPTTLELY